MNMYLLENLFDNQVLKQTKDSNGYYVKFNNFPAEIENRFG